jgi:hypothetical protein
MPLDSKLIDGTFRPALSHPNAEQSPMSLMDHARTDFKLLDRTTSVVSEIPSTVIDLEPQQAEAIHDLNFTTVRTIQTQLDALAAEDTNGQVFFLQTELETILNSIGTICRRDRSRLIRALQADESVRRNEIDTAFENARCCHIMGLNRLQMRFLIEYRTEMPKPIGEYDHIVQQARANAKQWDFERAQKQKERTDMICATEITRRKEVYERNYRATINACFKRQPSEMAAIDVRARVTLDAFEKNHVKQFSDQLAKFRRDLACTYKTWSMISRVRQGENQSSIAS